MTLHAYNFVLTHEYLITIKRTLLVEYVLYLPVDVVSKTVIRRVHNDGTKSYIKRKEALCNCCVPYLQYNEISA